MMENVIHFLFGNDKPNQTKQKASTGNPNLRKTKGKPPVKLIFPYTIIFSTSI